MKKLLTLILIAVTIAAAFIIGYLYGFGRPGAEVQGSLSSEGVWQTVQTWRVSTGKMPYRKSESLCSYARNRLGDVKTDWSHNQFNLNGELTWLTPHKYHGENLARRSHSSSDVVDAWLGSPSHRANLEARFTHSCVVCEGTYCVHMFGL